MQPRFLGQLGLADVVTAVNAALGFVAVAVAFVDPTLSARVILLAAIADGLDGVIARHRGSSEVGPILDSLADVSSFGVAPAVLVYVVATDGGGLTLTNPFTVVALAVTTVYVSIAVVRLAFYLRHDSDRPETEGVQTTLASTVLAVVLLAGVGTPTVLVALTAAFTYLMVTPITYPDLYARDAVVLGGLQALVVAFPVAFNRLLPRVLLLFALAYLVLAPFFYWRDTDETD